MASRVRDTDKGAKALSAMLGDLAKNKITVGVHADDGAAPHRRRAARGRRGAKGATVRIVDVAAIAEFGGRPWLRSTIDANQAQIDAHIREVTGQLVSGQLTDKKQALALIGLRIVGMVRRQFTSLAPNAPSTLAEKSGSTPLEDTGQFAGAIGVRVNGARVESL